jgi:ABC-type Mn2+/Zn2+ transport system ATPase subunit
VLSQHARSINNKIEMNSEIINFENVAIGYGKETLLQNINFSMNENDFIGIVGPNGAGKTTFLKTLLGSIKPIHGIVKRDKLKFGYVPQRDIVQPILPYTVFEVVLMGRHHLSGVFKRVTREDKMIAEDCLKRVGISDLRDYNFKNLSGGQRQRTLIARALAIQPNVLILDEPTNGMDTPSHYALLDLISELHRDNKLTILIVSHLLSDVANIVQKLVLMDRDFFQMGNIDDVLSEENLKKTYSSDFLVTKIQDEYIITSKHRK